MHLWCFRPRPGWDSWAVCLIIIAQPDTSPRRRRHTPNPPLLQVLRLVPTSASRILPLLVGNMPHKLRDRGTHCLYLRGLFALAESSAGWPIKEGVLVGVLDHLIAIDVEIRCAAEATMAWGLCAPAGGAAAPAAAIVRHVVLLFLRLWLLHAGRWLLVHGQHGAHTCELVRWLQVGGHRGRAD